jgi:hypothetical protein
LCHRKSPDRKCDASLMGRKVRHIVVFRPINIVVLPVRWH